MDLEQSERGGVDILAVRGPIHADDNDVFAEALEGLRRRKRFRLVVDAREIDYINSRAVGTLAAFSRDARISPSSEAMRRARSKVSGSSPSPNEESSIARWPRIDETIE